MTLMDHDIVLTDVTIPARAEETKLSAPAMARHLRRINPDGAHCFAVAMQKDAAWANADWGAYWSEIVRLTSAI